MVFGQNKGSAMGIGLGLWCVMTGQRWGGVCRGQVRGVVAAMVVVWVVVEVDEHVEVK